MDAAEGATVIGLNPYSFGNSNNTNPYGKSMRVCIAAFTLWRVNRPGVGYREQLDAGHGAFAAMLKAWHERNGWSHRVLPALAELLDFGRLHSSQISNLRNRKLSSPGPEVFLALGSCNQWLAEASMDGSLTAASQKRLDEQEELQTALQQSALPLLDGNGAALAAGELLEIFVGLRPLPPGFDLRIRDDEAAALSGALADLLSDGKTWRQCRDAVLEAYPVQKRQRRERFAEVMAGVRDYTAAELDAELPELMGTVAALGMGSVVATGPEALLERLRQGR